MSETLGLAGLHFPRRLQRGPAPHLHLQGQHLHTSPCSVFTSPSLCVRWPSASPIGTPVIPFSAHPPGQSRLLSHLEILILTTPAKTLFPCKATFTAPGIRTYSSAGTRGLLHPLTGLTWVL